MQLTLKKLLKLIQDVRKTGTLIIINLKLSGITWDNNCHFYNYYIY